MKVSIITIVFNNHTTITTCLRSVQCQSYPNIEHIVIDGGSTDGTQEQIFPFLDTIAYYVSEKDGGLYEALNKGIRQCTGDIVGILHSDDLFYETTTVQKVVDTFLQSKADLVYANGMYVVKNNVNKVKRVYGSKPYELKDLCFGRIPLHTTIYVKREVFEKYGLYDTQYTIASDYEISLRWFVNPQLKKHFLNEWVVKMRLGGKSTSANLQKRKSTEDLAIINHYQLWGKITLFLKIARKIPQYLKPYFVKY
ncbi:glycosyltransferase [Flavobacterium fluvii]|uniref:Glycosyltransferase n=1 Tax=Flavobacterium fluvii TaxID=468056 RepID=A0A1M5IL24_9FLAO|nr:glycosyltransferase family 2 protein [Flavobacterium fluvii]SHG28987.1 glycosyltransferase [Flavobacterium fluvii]